MDAEFQEALEKAVQAQLKELGNDLLTALQKVTFKWYALKDYPLLTTERIQTYLGDTFKVKVHQGEAGYGWFIRVCRTLE